MLNLHRPTSSSSTTNFPCLSPCLLVRVLLPLIFVTCNWFTYIAEERTWTFSSLALIHVGSEVLAEMVMKRSNFWDITPCSPLKFNRLFVGISSLNFQGQRNKPSKKPTKAVSSPQFLSYGASPKVIVELVAMLFCIPEARVQILVRRPTFWLKDFVVFLNAFQTNARI
jgi:hypothetical protein